MLVFDEAVINLIPDRKGTAVLYDTVSETVCHMRASAPISSDWSNDIKKDFEGRK